MTRRLFIGGILSIVCLAASCLLLSLPAYADDGKHCILDSEEYAVIAAVLFPADRDLSANKNKHHTGRPVDLPGISSSFIALSGQTRQEKLESSDNTADPDMVADYNRRNALECHIDAEKLRVLVPSGNRISVVSPEEQKRRLNTGVDSGDDFRSKHSLFSGLTYVSRPGFNLQKTHAIIQINHIADFEMGVGYRVFLGKNSQSGPWILVNVVQNRMY